MLRFPEYLFPANAIDHRFLFNDIYKYADELIKLINDNLKEPVNVRLVLLKYISAWNVDLNDYELLPDKERLSNYITFYLQDIIEMNDICNSDLEKIIDFYKKLIENDFIPTKKNTIYLNLI